MFVYADRFPKPYLHNIASAALTNIKYLLMYKRAPIDKMGKAIKLIECLVYMVSLKNFETNFVELRTLI